MVDAGKTGKLLNGEKVFCRMLKCKNQFSVDNPEIKISFSIMSQVVGT